MASRGAVISIRRSSGHYQDATRSYRIDVDGRQVGHLKPGESMEVPVAVGGHSVVARIDWSGSPAVHVDLGDGDELHLVVKPSANGWTKLFSRSGWLSLEREPASAP
jgi:hypothetical protein